MQSTHKHEMVVLNSVCSWRLSQMMAQKHWSRHLRLTMLTWKSERKGGPRKNNRPIRLAPLACETFDRFRAKVPASYLLCLLGCRQANFRNCSTISYPDNHQKRLMHLPCNLDTGSCRLVLPGFLARGKARVNGKSNTKKSDILSRTGTANRQRVLASQDFPVPVCS